MHHLLLSKEKVVRSEPQAILETIFAGMSHAAREDVTSPVIGPLANSAYGPELIRTLEQYLADNLNVSQAAKHLYLHRNTLLYRLAKIRSLTGLDPRNFEQALELKLALLLWQQNNGQNSGGFLRRGKNLGAEPAKYALR